MAPKPQVLFAALAAALLAVTPAAGRNAPPPTPAPVLPADGTVVDSLPAFGWNRVSGTAKYEFQLAADPGFNAPIASVFTRNTRATLDKTVANGSYWWRVRAVDSAGAVSAWTPPWSLVKNWAASPTLAAPGNGASIVYPGTPLTLRWNAVPGAARYRVHLATDPTLGSSVSTNYPATTQALAFSPPELLWAGEYYWAVTPVDAQGNLGSRSPIWSFTWVWPTTTTARVDDLEPAPEFYDPQFSWDPVPGAARYEVEVNSSAQFASGSKVCCGGTTIATFLAPREVLPDNDYYWRVRAIDGRGNSGVWNEGPRFEKRFDKVPPVASPSIKNLHMRDLAGDPGTDLDTRTPGYQTNVPIVTWDPVPGASAYRVDVAPFRNDLCDYGASPIERWSSHTATNAWTPLGPNGLAAPPFPPPTTIFPSKDVAQPVANQPYCVRVRARSGRDGLVEVYGDYTELRLDGMQWAFEWTGMPAGGACSPSCEPGYLGRDDYLLPLRGTEVGRMPLLTWKPLSDKQSYWVIVAKDSNFGTIVDYALTRIPAYAPRTPTGPRTYADETTAYYWAVLPATNADGGLAASEPRDAAASAFEKESTPPTLVAPAASAVVTGQPTFRWTRTEGARRYHVQVARDASFGELVEDARTVSSGYSSNTTYPADTLLYWRVQAEDEELRGLTWSAVGTFRRTLASPVLDPANPTAGDLIPTVRWSPVPGAVSYDFEVQLPDNASKRDGRGIHATAATFVEMTGTGVFQWRVRANFPAAFGTTPGPYSAYASFVRTIREPGSPREEVGDERLLVSWSPKTGSRRYRVQLAARPDFVPALETVTTDNTSFASPLTHPSYATGGTFYWRVAAVDADGAVGDFTATRSFTLPALPGGTTSATSPTSPTVKLMRLAARGYPVKGRRVRIVVYVRDRATLRALPRTVVRVSGAGVAVQTKRTGTGGRVRFYVRATRYGRVTFRASRVGYRTAYLYRRVR